MIQGNRRYKINGPDATTDIAQLKQRRFYWVLVRSSTNDPEWQPARFAGVAGFNSDVGHHFIEIVEIGPELTSSWPRVG